MPTQIDETWNVLELVYTERLAQEQKWGVQSKTPAEWVVVEGEEFGEVCREVFETHKATGNSNSVTPHLIDEWVQVAAVAVAAIEDLLGNMGQRPAEYLHERNVTSR